MFYGEFDYKIDDKGRVPIPPRFRNALKDGVVLTPGAEKCITAYTLTEWRKLATTLTDSSLTRSKMRRLSRALFATAFSTRIDNQGRILLHRVYRYFPGVLLGGGLYAWGVDN